MPEAQQDIDALLAEVNALADEAVASIAGSGDFAPGTAAPSAPAAAADNPPADNLSAASLPASASTHEASAPAAEPVGSPAAVASPIHTRPGVTADASGAVSVSRSVKTGRISTGPEMRQAAEVTRILNIEVPIIVQLSSRTMPLGEILNLTTGSIIEFDKPADSELDLNVNNKCIGNGQAVKVGENFGLRVARVGSLRERIQALGG